MKRKFFAFTLLVMAVLSLSSCLSSDDGESSDVTYSHDTAITAFSLGTLKRTYYKAASSKDTTVEVTGSNYAFAIDQSARKIYNPDSLPVGTRIDAVLATISAKNSNYIQLCYKSQEDKDSLAWYQSSDSVLLPKLQYMRVYSQDGAVYADYRLDVRVHKEEADSFVWRSMATDAAALQAFRAMDGMKAVAVGCQLFVFGGNDAMNLGYKSNDGKSWSQLNLAGINLGEQGYEGIVALDGALYAVDKDGKVCKSTDGENWSIVAANASAKRLLGASSLYLYAQTTNGISVSKDHGATWTAESIDAVADSLPTRSLSMAIVPNASTVHAENLLLLGTHAEAHQDSIAVAWTTTVDYDDAENPGQWNYVNYDANQPGKLPYLSQIFVAPGTGCCVALGSNGKWYKSITGGLKWTIDTTVSMPKVVDANGTIVKTFNAKAPFAFVRSSDNYYWVISSEGQVWKGRYNKDGWK